MNSVLNSGVVNMVVDGEVAVINLNNPPVNAICHEMRVGILKSIAEAERLQVKGAIIIGHGHNFIAGSDLKEFDRPIEFPELPDVIECFENASFPVLAAIQGVALGGGLELALGCDYRIAAHKALLGLPEVSLGMVPGAGGTQRLPRLSGRIRAIELITGSLRIDAIKALQYNIVDAVTEEDLLHSAKQFLATKYATKNIVKNRAVPDEDESEVNLIAEKSLKRGKGRPNVAEAIRLVKASAQKDVDAVLKDERQVFQQLRISEDAFALRYQFFAERKAVEINIESQGLNKEIQKIAVIGGGTMGQGIVRALLASRMQVTLIERDEIALNKALTSIQADALKPHAKYAKNLSHLNGLSDLNDLKDCDLVIEAVFEDMDVKKGLLKQLESIVPQHTILATNTSYLDIDEMISELKHPERVVGLHFFSPADVMKLLEIVNTEKTSEETLWKALKFSKKLAKQAVIAKVGEGFIGNRIYAAYRRCAELLVLDGASPDQVDQAIRNFGMAMGPFEVSDMSGLDIAWAMRKRLESTRDPQARYVDIADKLCENNRLGRKTTKGWYNYTTEKKFIDHDVKQFILSSRSDAQIQVQDFNEETIQHQLLAAIINEAVCVLEDGIAQRASDIDVVLVNGYGFPRWRGGPLYWAAQQPQDVLKQDFALLSNTVGHGYRQGNVEHYLAEIRAKH